jgi:glucosamine-6-phosphate deaminase
MSLHQPLLEVLADARAAASRTAMLVRDRISAGGRAVLGLATGATMVPVYAELVAFARADGLSFRDMSSFNLDEYVGVPPSAPASFHAYMQRHLLAHVDLAVSRTHIPDGMAVDLEVEAARYEGAIAGAFGIDLQLLGIGNNGHIGFNEPGSDFHSRTRVVTLSEQTRQANAEAFAPGEAPERALTVGIATILEAREIVLLATGTEKAEAIAAALLGPISTDCPASALRQHPRVRIICDEAAAAGIGGASEAARGRA